MADLVAQEQEKIIAVAKAVALAVVEAADAREKVVANEGNTTAAVIADLQARMKFFEEQQRTFVAKMDESFKSVFDRINQIIDGRLPYSITIIITLLACLCTGLIVAFMSKM